MAAASQSETTQIEIDTTYMALKEHHKITMKVNKKSIDLPVEITKDNKVVLKYYDSLSYFIFRTIPTLEYSTTDGKEIELPEYPTPEELHEFLKQKIRENILLCDDYERHKKFLDEIFSVITTQNILDECRESQIKMDTWCYRGIIRQSTEKNGFLDNCVKLMQLKERYPHLDLSFLKDERIAVQIDALYNFYKKNLK